MRISGWLEGWKKTFPSLGGKITQLTLFSIIPTYFLSVFSIFDKFAARVRKFLWSKTDEWRRDYLVGWTACRLRSERNQGLRNIHPRNGAPLIKWSWNFPRGSNPFLHRIIRSTYGSQSNSHIILRWWHQCSLRCYCLAFSNFSC